MRSLLRVFLLFAISLLAAPAGSQSTAARQDPQRRVADEAEAAQRVRRPCDARGEDSIKFKQEQEMARQRNKERQAALKKDTDKLLELAKQLKEYVDKTDENVLSVEVLKKAEEIEKLSKSVREKMKADEYYPSVCLGGGDPQ